MAADKKPHIPVESLKHQVSRPNIPTEELRDFVKKDETRPGTILYPRDSSLDPQLVWKGKATGAGGRIPQVLDQPGMPRFWRGRFG